MRSKGSISGVESVERKGSHISILHVWQMKESDLIRGAQLKEQGLK